MTATKPLEIPLPLKIKKEKDELLSSENSDDPDSDSSTSSLLLQPSILHSDCLTRIDPNDFLRLTSMVRRVYFSYLHKSIINNYKTCCRPIKEEKLSRADLKKFCSLLELNAVKASVETSLYRQTILKLISEIKKDTINNKIHSKLAVYLDTPSNTVDVAVQTCFNEQDNTQDSYNSINLSTISTHQDINYPCRVNREQVSEDVNSSDERLEQDGGEAFQDGADPKNDSIINESELEDRINKDIMDVFGNSSSNIDGIDEKRSKDVDNIDDDTLVQNLESIFGESDDSNDLMTLIEKHSSVKKPNADIKAINNKTVNFNCPINSEINFENNIRNDSNNKLEDIHLKVKEFKVNYGGKRKVSFKDYKKSKKRSLEESKYKDDDKQTKRMRDFWLVEKTHQVSKLRDKMMELSVTNNRKHERIRHKFQELFGEDEEEMMPESPIHIEEHLNACKERIAPWVVKYLMPYYEEKINGNKLLFKAVAKHVADKLILENTFPEEDCVNKYITEYFKNKVCIKTEADIYI